MDDVLLFSDNYRLFNVNVNELKGDEFDEFIFKVHIYGKSEVLKTLLTKKNKKNRYIAILDRCLARALKDKAFMFNNEKHFLDSVTLGALPDLIENEAQKFGVVIHPGFRVYRLKLINELEDLYENANRRVFEDAVMRNLRARNGTFMYKLDLISMLMEEPRYTYCWLKYIELSTRKIPKALRKLKNVYEGDAKEFIKSMNYPPVSLNIAGDNNIASCKVFDKSYKLVTVSTPETFNDFIKNYFVRSKPKVLAIDVETIPVVNKLALLQLATDEWCCIIDVYALYNQLYDRQWITLMNHIFDSEITRIGFAFRTDLYFIGNTFSFLKPMLQDSECKTLCTQKLVEDIVKIPEAAATVFPKGKYDTPSLFNVTKTILGHELVKEEQLSDWSKRPLSNEQILYSVTDAVVVILLKNKIESDLQNKIGDDKTSKIVNNAFVVLKDEKKASGIKAMKNVTNNFKNLSVANTGPDANNLMEVQCKKCQSFTVGSIPSPLYILTHKITMVLRKNCLDVERDWVGLKEAALNVKNMQPSDYDGFSVNITLKDSKRISNRIIFKCKNYKIRPLTSLIVSQKRDLDFVPSDTVLQGSKEGISHVLCLNCGYVSLKKSQIANKNTKCTKGRDFDVREKICETLRQVFA